jgi:hypothetical protein
VAHHHISVWQAARHSDGGREVKRGCSSSDGLIARADALDGNRESKVVRKGMKELWCRRRDACLPPLLGEPTPS